MGSISDSGAASSAASAGPGRRMKALYAFCMHTSRNAFSAFMDLKVYGAENIPAAGGLLVCSNHASFLDPPLVASACTERELTFLARKTLWRNPWFGRLITALNSIPVDQEKPDMTSLKTMIKKIRSGEMVLIFPEGQRTPDGNFCPAQPGTGLVAVKAGRPVLPVRLFGTYEAWPIRGKFRRHPVRVVIGAPLDLQPFISAFQGDDRALYQAVSERIMQEIASLQIPRPF